jgi:hypothetical protein
MLKKFAAVPKDNSREPFPAVAMISLKWLRVEITPDDRHDFVWQRVDDNLVANQDVYS